MASSCCVLSEEGALVGMLEKYKSLQSTDLPQSLLITSTTVLWGLLVVSSKLYGVLDENVYHLLKVHLDYT